MFDFHHLDNSESAILLSGKALATCSATENNSANLGGACWTSTLTSLSPAHEPMGGTGNIAWHLLWFSRKRVCERKKTEADELTLTALKITKQNQREEEKMTNILGIYNQEERRIKMLSGDWSKSERDDRHHSNRNRQFELHFSFLTDQNAHEDTVP